jgi:hypothetical protein
MTYDVRNDVQRALYALLTGADEGCGPAARSSQQSRGS